MIDLSSLVRSAQGGEAIGNIATRFGLTPEQAQGAVDALLPAIQMGLQNATRTGQAGSILSQMADPAHGGGAEAQAGPGAASAGSILGSLFGGHAATAGVAQQAAAQSGVPASIIQAMLPMIVSMVMGGLFKGAQNGAFGGAIGGILSSVLGGGGLGSVFGGPAPKGAGQGSGTGEGGLGGLIGSVLGSLLGGGNTQAPGAPQREEAPPAPRETGRPAASATPESTLDELSSMIQSGTPPAPDHESRLASIIGR